MNIIISGASRGIGNLLASKLLSAGEVVGINYYESSEMAISLHQQFPNTSMLLPFDVRNYIDAKSYVDKFIEKFQNIDVLVNNAGVGGTPQFFIRIKPETNRRIVETNLIGTINCTQVSLLHMLKRNKGLIVNISSVAANISAKGLSTYAVTKSAIDKFTQLIELEVYDKGIRIVNPTLPPIKDIGMFSSLPDKYIDNLPDNMKSIMTSGEEITNKIIQQIKNWSKEYEEKINS